MLSIARISDLMYFEKYCRAGFEPAGEWHGEGARRLGLTGEAQSDHVLALGRGFSPWDGHKLIQNAGTDRHRSGWDLCWSASKSFSTFLANASDPIREKGIWCLHEAVKRALSLGEIECGWTRRGKGGCIVERASVPFVLYEHCTNRTNDPNWHIHSELLNVAFGEDCQTRTVLSRPWFRWKMALGALFRAELAHLCQTELGLGIVRTQHGFEIIGVPVNLNEEFSKRSHDIRAELARRGQFSAKAAEFATLDTRPKKEHTPRSVLFKVWQEVSASFGFTHEQAEKLCHQHERPALSFQQLDSSIRQSIDLLTESKAHFSKRELLLDLANRLTGRGISAVELVAGVTRFLNVAPEIIHLREIDLERQFTTKKMLRVETELLVNAEKLYDRQAFAVPERIIEDVLTRHRGVAERPEQVTALRHILSEGSLKLVSGLPGTGKTFVLDAAREAFELAGYEVKGCAVAGKAVQELKAKAHCQADTIAKLIFDLEATPLTSATHHARQMGRAAIGKPTYPLERMTLGPRTVLLVDEMGMLDTPLAHKILSHAERVGAKIVGTGDRRQLQPIGAGAPFAGLLTRLEHVQLQQIKRQDNPRDVAAIRALADGRVQDMLTNYRDRGLIHVAADRRAAIEKLVSDWASRGGVANPRDHAIFVCTNADRIAINERAQKARLDTGRLEPDRFITIRRQEHIEGCGNKIIREDLHVGDEVMCLKRSKRLGLENGHLGTVTRIDPETRMLTLRLETAAGQPREVQISPNVYPYLQLGYARTTHKAQGETVPFGYVLIGGAMQGLEMTYTQVSRSKVQTSLYVDLVDAGDNLEGLARLLERSHAKMLAHDLLPPIHQPEPLADHGLPQHDELDHERLLTRADVERLPAELDQLQEPDAWLPADPVPPLDDLESAGFEPER